MEELKPTAADQFFLNWPMIVLPARMIQNASCILLGIATGIIAWHFYLPAAIFLPVIWVKTPSKKAAWLVGLGYHLAASKGLIFGVPVFFDSTIFYGVFLWAVAGLIQSLPYYLFFYVRNPYLSIVFLLISLILPPVGIVGWANPLTGAGLIFPGTGFAGLFLSLVLIFLAVWLLRKKNTWAFCLLIATVLLLPGILKPPDVRDDSFKGVSTHYTGNPANIGDQFYRDYQKFTQIYGDYRQTDFKVLALPEASAGIWFDSTKDLWGRWQKNLKNDQSIIIPTLLPVSSQGMETYNALIEMKKDGFTVLYKARQSVPVAMWNPWSKDNVKNNWFDDPVFEVAGKKETALICYEAYLTWPILQSFLSGDPEIIFFVANHWWSKNTSLLRIQEKCVSAWARLFNARLISTVNH